MVANEKANGAHVQARAWLTSYYLVDIVDLVQERVIFRRTK